MIVTGDMLCAVWRSGEALLPVRYDLKRCRKGTKILIEYKSGFCQTAEINGLEYHISASYDDALLELKDFKKPAPFLVGVSGDKYSMMDVINTVNIIDSPVIGVDVII